MCSAFYDLAFVHDQDCIGFQNGRQPMSDGDCCSAIHQSCKCLLYLAFSVGI